jgi:hypothetical protein
MANRRRIRRRKTVDNGTPYMKGRRTVTSVYLRPEVLLALQNLSASTDIPMAHYLRRAVDEFLEKHGISVPKPKKVR